MFKTVAFATLLAASCGVNAATTWSFSYTGFRDDATGYFDPSRELVGSFSGDDVNSDGIVEKNEITSFLLNGMDYIGCASTSNDYYQCGTESFNFQLEGTKLSFAARLYSFDPEGNFAGHSYLSGIEDVEYNFFPFAPFYQSYQWTEDTQFAVRQVVVLDAPVLTVPEPGTWAMLGTGLLLVAGATRRRQTAQAARG